MPPRQHYILGKPAQVPFELLLGWNKDLVARPGPPISDVPLTKAGLFEPLWSASQTPRDLFTHHADEHDIGGRCHYEAHRFVRRTNDREALIYVDRSCLDQNSVQDTTNRRAGCAVVFKPPPYSTKQRILSFRLEAEGPTGVAYPQSSNRAELRAVIAALQYRHWYGEGWQKLVIASDSEYVVLGITHRIETWVKHGWRTSSGSVKNQDLWQTLLDLINTFAEEGTEILFWRIPRELNTEADAAAKEAAGHLPPVSHFTSRHGVMM